MLAITSGQAASTPPGSAASFSASGDALDDVMSALEAKEKIGVLKDTRDNLKQDTNVKYRNSRVLQASEDKIDLENMYLRLGITSAKTQQRIAEKLPELDWLNKAVGSALGINKLGGRK